MKELIKKYIAASINYGAAQEEGDSKKVNKNAAAIRKIRLQFKENYPLYAKELEPLLQHENDYVRLKSAFDLLPVMTDKAEETLLELSVRKGLIGFEAEITLQEWKKGNIKY